jgi:hypothetical protein
MIDRSGRGARGADARSRHRPSGLPYPAATANPQVGPIPVEILGPSGPVTMEIQRPAGLADPGGSLDSGAPPAGPVTGSIAVKLTVLFRGAKPTTNSATFNARLGDALRALVPGATVARPFSVAIGAPQAISPPSVSGAAAVAALTTLAGAAGAATQAVRGIYDFLRSRNMMPGWWATISGGVVQSRTPMDQAQLRRAFARAFWQSTTWEAAPGVAVPPDGGPMQNALDRANACTGGEDRNAFVSRACLRWQWQRDESLAIINAQQPQSQAPGTTAQTPATAPVAAPQAAAPLCTVTSQAQFWLRPTATFDRVGPNFPAGTRVEILSRAQGNQGSLSLYQARVNGQVGYVAMNDREVASCAAAFARTTGASTPAPMPSVPAPTSSQPAASTPSAPRPVSTPSTSSAPNTSAAITGRIPPGSGQAASSAGRTALYAGGAVLAAGAVAAAVLLATSKPAPRAGKASR